MLRGIIIAGVVIALLSGCASLDRLARWRIGEQTAREIELEAAEKVLNSND